MGFRLLIPALLCVLLALVAPLVASVSLPSLPSLNLDPNHTLPVLMPPAPSTGPGPPSSWPEPVAEGSVVGLGRAGPMYGTP